MYGQIDCDYNQFMWILLPEAFFTRQYGNSETIPSDLILFQAVNFEFIVETVWFGLDRRFEQTDKINGFWFALIEFGLVWFAYSTDTKTN